VIYAPMGDARRNQAPGQEGQAYYIRIGASTVVAKNQIRRSCCSDGRDPFDDGAGPMRPSTALAKHRIAKFSATSVVYLADQD